MNPLCKFPYQSTTPKLLTLAMRHYTSKVAEEGLEQTSIRCAQRESCEALYHQSKAWKAGWLCQHR